MSRKKSRAERELGVVEGLEWLREHAPEKFTEMMQLLARLVAENEQQATVP